MSENPELTFWCYTYCLISNIGPFEDIEHFSFDQWCAAIDTLDDLRRDVVWARKDKKSADAAAD